MEDELRFEMEIIRNQIEYLFFKLEEVIRRIERIEESLTELRR
ncbi:MAG: hypothetical protein QXO55_06560 [Candidatus Korarchaeum sp.]